MTVAEIQENSECFCFTGVTFERAAIYLLSQIAAGGGGGGGSAAFTVGTGNPEGVVTGSPGDRFWDSVNNFQYTKVTGTATNTGWFNS